MCTNTQMWRTEASVRVDKFSLKRVGAGQAGCSSHLHLPKIAEEQLVLVPLSMPACTHGQPCTANRADCILSTMKLRVT